MQKVELKKLEMQSLDKLDMNIESIAKLFPNVITEKEDKDGNIIKAIDFNLFRQMFSTDLVEDSNERYRLDWPGKKASILKANTPINKTLRPVREDSVNFDTTENLYIEGDNFEVLKILQESYLGKIKMIYIDPPYNKGKDFIYRDNLNQTIEEYEDELQIFDENGGKLVKNTDTNGRFHSDWLSMMYERILVGRDLLNETGAIFISIDQDEVHNLRKICDDVFGEENFVNQIVVKMSEMKGAKLAHIDKKFPKINEYLLIYCKNKETFGLKPVKIEKNEHELLKYAGYYNKKIIDINAPVHEWAYESVKYGHEEKMSYSESMIYLVKPDKDKDFTIENNKFIKVKNTEGKEDYFYNDNGEIKKVLFLKDNSTTYLGDLWTNISTININKENYQIPTYTNGQKPIDLILQLFESFIDNNDIIMDFFSGSGTLGDAILRFNFSKFVKCKFILAQIKEPIELTSGMDSETKKAVQNLINFLSEIGKPLYLTEIGKERIRRAGKKIVEENKDKEGIDRLDIGFRVYKVDSSNMKDVYYHPSEIAQNNLFDLASNIKEDRTSEDLLTQVILSSGLTLDLPIEKKSFSGNDVYLVAGNSLVACFDEYVDFAIIEEIAKLEPLKVIFRDASFRTDSDRINFETKFKKLSPDTDIRVI